MNGLVCGEILERVDGVFKNTGVIVYLNPGNMKYACYNPQTGVTIVQIESEDMIFVDGDVFGKVSKG